MTSESSSQASATGAGEARNKANERLGRWVRKKYRIDQLLGVGGMASVYAASHRNGARVALKILHTEFAREEAIKQRFLREGYVANRVDHPGRVAILDDDETEEGEPFLVMELLEGESLQQLWKRCKRKIPVIDALRIAGDVLDTLVPFHEANVIHRDLKPANIFITHAGEVKLLDFGVAQLREGDEALTRAGTALGTPSYMSPEQAMGKSDQLDGRSDVFAMGATLFAILSGRRLHHGKSDNEAFILAATQPAASLARSAAQLPVEIIALVDKSLQWDRRKRFKDAAEMRDACRVLLDQFRGTEDLGRESVLPERPSYTPTIQDSPVALRDAPAPPPPAAPPPVPHQAAAPVALDPTPGPDTALSSPEHTPLSSPAHTPRSSPSHGTPAVSSASAAQGAAQSAAQGAAQPGRAPFGRPAARSSRPPAPRTAVDGAAESVPPTAGLDGDKLVDVFVRLEKALPTLRHYGLDHPQGQQKLKAIHRGMLDALREQADGLRWDVHPFCFTRGPDVVWEPPPPYDLVPYLLASTGIETVTVLPGVRESEVDAFLRAVVIAPQTGEGDDIAAALWEAGLEHIQCKIRDDLAGANARARVKFFGESDEVEADLRVELAEVVEVMSALAGPALDKLGETEAAALAIAVDKAGFRAAQKASDALALDGAIRTALSAQLRIDDAEWSDRFYDVASEAWADATSRQDTALLLEPLGRHTELLATAARWKELVELHDVLLERLASVSGEEAGAITRVMFVWPVLERAFADAQGDRLEAEVRAQLVDALWRVVPTLESTMTDKFLRLANHLPPGELLELSLGYVEGTLAGNEQAVIELLDAIKPDLAQRVLATITKSQEPSVIELLKPLLASRNAALRCEATALLSQSPEMLSQQLVKMLASADASLRMAALGTMMRHEIREVGPALVRLVEGDEFVKRPRDEQKRILEALFTLSAARAERLLTEILDKHGMLSDETVDQIRTLAAEGLGAHASTAEPLKALENASRLRPWNTAGLRSAASSAGAAIRARLEAAARARASESKP